MMMTHGTGTRPDPAAVTSLLPEDSLTLPLRCQVCGDAASGNHFGVLSCEGCKGFFRRSVCNLRRYDCSRKQNCKIEKSTRNKCQQCRLRKCITAGMKMEIVQMRRVQLAPTAMIAKSPSPLEISECEAAIVPLCFPNDNEGAPPPLSHPTYNDTDGCTPGHNAEGETVYYNIKKALNNADMLSAYPEVIVPADHDVTLLDGLDGMKSFFMCILEWAHYIPEFARLSNYERNLLIDNSWCDLSTLQLAANNQTASTIFQLGNGLCFSFQQIQDQTLRHLVNRVKDEIVSWLNTMSIDCVELAHIKALLLFNSETKQLSSESKATVQQCQDRILTSLNGHISSQYQFLPLRLSHILLHTVSIRLVSLDWLQHMDVQATTNQSSQLDGHLDTD